MDIEDTMARSMICQFYGLKNRYASQEMSEFTHRIGISTSNIDTFFERRVKKCEGVISWDSTTIGTWAKDNGLADYVKNNKDNEDIPQIKKAFASDSRGIPVMYEIYPGTMSDIATMEAFVKRIQRYDSRDVIFVMDRGYESGAGLKFLQSSGARFVLPAKIQGPALKSLLTDFKKPVQKTMYFDDHAYSVWETEIGLRESGRKLTDGRNAWEFVRLEQTDNELPSAKEGLLTVKAFVCHDTESYSDEIQNFRMMLRDISARLDAIDSPDPMTAFKEATCKASKYFDAKPNGRKIEYRLKENAVSFKENRAGTFIMLTSPEMTWDQMMSAYDARRLVEQNFDTDKTLYGRFGTRDPVTIQGREFIRFVSLILRCELTRMLRDNEHAESVDNVLNSVGAISAMGRDKEWFVKNVGKKHRILFDDLNLEIPDAVETDMQIFTREEVDEPQPDV